VNVGWPFSRTSLLPAVSDAREFIRFLLTRPGIGPGARILCASPESSALIPELAGAGICVTCLAEAESSLESGDSEQSPAECWIGAEPRECFESGYPDYDLILNTLPIPETEDLLSRRPLISTGSRLSCLRPGGTLVSFASTGSGHTPGCCLRLYNCFPGETRILPLTGAQWPSGPGATDRFVLVKSIPQERIGWQEWDRLAVVQAGRKQACCVHRRRVA